jgi:hypothetical protein
VNWTIFWFWIVYNNDADFEPTLLYPVSQNFNQLAKERVAGAVPGKRVLRWYHKWRLLRLAIYSAE